MKKLLISTLAALMVFAAGGTAFAAATTVSGPAFSDIAGHEAEFELTVMKALGILAGDAGTTIVRPDDTITRAEVAKVVVTMAGRDSIAAGMAGVRPQFTDEVPTWAWGYVNCAQVMGLVGGYEDGTFRASSPVTYAEVITMLVRSVSGHKEQVTAGFWPYNFLFHAIDHGFTGDVDMGFANLPAPRGDVARLVFATMQVERLDKDGQDAGNAYLQGRVFSDVLSNHNLATNYLDLQEAGAKTLAASVYVVGTGNLETLMNVSVQAVADAEGEVLVIGKGQATTSFTGWLTGLDATVMTAYKLVFADGTKIALPHDAQGDLLPVPTRRNGVLDYDVLDLIKCDGVSAKPRIRCTVNFDAAGKAKFITAVKFTGCPECSGGGPGPGYITSITVSDDDDDTLVEFRRTTFPAHYVDCDFTIPASARVTLNGAVIDRDELALWDVFWFARSDDNWSEAFEVMAVRNTVQGKIDAKWQTTTSDGTTKYVTIEKDNGTKATFTNLSPTDPVLGGYYKFALDMDGALGIEISAETVTPYVLVQGFSDYGAYKTVTVDVRGNEVTYQLDGEPFDHTVINQFGELDIDSITGKATGFTAKALSGAFKVMAVDAANKTMTLYDNTNYFFITDKDFVVYSKAAKYIGVEGLKVGDWLKADDGKVIFQVIDEPVR